MTTQDDNLISIRLSSDRLEASLVIMPGIDRNYVSADVALAKALSQAIQPGPKLNQSISEAINAFNSHDLESYGEFRYLVAEGQPSEDGVDGQFVLEPDLEAIHEHSKKRVIENGPPAESDSADETLDHRERSTLMVVKAGQRLGQVQRATDGIDGTDVCGNTIRAKAGKQAPVTFDSQTIELHENGAVIAKIAGQLVIEHNSVHISPSLIINDYVDYSTGNIDFPGNIEVHRGIRDCFEVTSGKSIKVMGLVEAADLVAARNIELPGGISGREKGTLHAGRDLIAHYLNGAECRVGRNLVVDKEICDCDIFVIGNVRSPSATIMGGHLSALGACEFQQVGSEAGSHTVISLGRADALDELVRDSLGLIKKLADKAAKAHAQMQELRDDPDASSLKAEMMTTLQFEAAEAEAKIVPIKDALQAAYTLIKDNCEPVLTVQGMLCQDTDIRAGGTRAVFKQCLKGPIAIKLDEQGEMICLDLNTGGITPVKNLATLSPDQTSYRFQDLSAEFRKSA